MRERKYRNNPLSLYPGKYEDSSYPAIPFENTLVVGRCGSGKTTLMNELILKLLYAHHDVVEIHAWLGHYIGNVWRASKEKTMSSVHVYPGLTSTLEKENKTSLQDFVDSIIQDIDNRSRLLGETHQTFYEYLSKNSATAFPYRFCILEEPEIEFYSNSKKLSKDLDYILRLGPAVGVITCVLTSGSILKEIDNSTLDLFRNRLCLQTSQEFSNKVLNCGVAGDRELSRGFVYYVDNCSVFKSPIKLLVPFKSNEFIKQLIEVLSTSTL